MQFRVSRVSGAGRKRSAFEVSSGAISGAHFAAAGSLLLLACEAFHGSAYPTLAAADAGMVTYLAAHFLGLQCLSVALLSSVGAFLGERAGAGSGRPASSVSAYLTAGLHHLGLVYHSGDSLSLLALKTALAEVVFFGTLWLPLAWLISAGCSRRGKVA